MKLTSYQEDVYSAKICPYCKSSTKTVSEEVIYGISYTGKAVICCINYPVCDSYVGTHKDGTPLGRLANNQLRQDKISAHKFFDPLWQSKEYKRGTLYQMLADYLEIPGEYCHIGFFNRKTLKKVIYWSRMLTK